jgi:APA family basic amino acid/polyamine antiporter
VTTTRRVGLLGATGIGAGAMLGAGVFTVWGPATDRAGSLLLWAVALAGLVAIINALSTAQLAAFHPVAGGAYSFGRRELHPLVGFIAGIGFVVGKTASVAAIALALGLYVWPAQAPVVATVAIASAWVLNARGVERTAAAATTIAAVVVVALATFMIASVSPTADDVLPAAPTDPAPNLFVYEPRSWFGVMTAAALIFFAFAGYARIATLGEEVLAPARTIPRAIVLALSVVLALYLTLAATLLAVLGPEQLAASDAPVADLVSGTGIPRAVVTIVAATAAFGSLVALMAGVGRTSMAMARERDLPGVLARQGASGAPWVAEGVSAVVAVALAWLGGLTFAIAMSSFAVLIYYAVANVAAFAAGRRGNVAGLRVWPVAALVGAALCVLLAFALPPQAVVAAVVALALAVGARAGRARRRA